MPRTFLIAPVRGYAADAFRRTVAQLEADGWTVHWPARDTNQNDAIGLQICETNRNAIQTADCVHLIWDGVSQGCLFDLGMAFALGKPVHVIDVPPATAGKSFQNIARALSDRAAKPPAS